MVDIIDVNDLKTMPWREFGVARSPCDWLQLQRLGQYVEFVAKPSLEYLRDNKHEFDLIFLDGDLRAATVYQKLPMAI